MKFILSVVISVIVTLVVRATGSEAAPFVLHPIASLGIAVAVLVLAGKVLALLPCIGCSPEERAYRRHIRSYVEQHRSTWEGQELIYIDTGHVFHVCVQRVRVNSSGVSLRLQSLPTRGFQPGQRRIACSTGWDSISVGASYICEPNIPWELITNAEMSARVARDVADYVGLTGPEEACPDVLGFTRSRLMGSEIVADAELRESEIPSDSAPFSEVVKFALSYDPRVSSEAGHEKQVLEHLRSDSLPDTLRDSRAVLKKLVANYGFRTEESAMVRRLISHIRDLIRARDG